MSFLRKKVIVVRESQKNNSQNPINRVEEQQPSLTQSKWGRREQPPREKSSTAPYSPQSLPKEARVSPFDSDEFDEKSFDVSWKEQVKAMETNEELINDMLNAKEEKKEEEKKQEPKKEKETPKPSKVKLETKISDDQLRAGLLGRFVFPKVNTEDKKEFQKFEFQKIAMPAMILGLVFSAGLIVVLLLLDSGLL